MTEHLPQGQHALVDGRDADAVLLDQSSVIRDLTLKALELIGATVLDVCCHAFDPQGCTVVVVLAESHASVHTYPEHGCYMIDVFTCGGLDARGAALEIAEQIGGEFNIRVVERGQKNPGKNAGAFELFKKLRATIWTSAQR